MPSAVFGTRQRLMRKANNSIFAGLCYEVKIMEYGLAHVCEKEDGEE